MNTQVLILSLLLAVPAAAGEFIRDDVTVGRQVERSQLIVTGTVSGLRDIPDGRVATLDVDEALKGALDGSAIQVFTSRGDSLSAPFEIGQRVLLFLSARKDGWPRWTPARGSRSVVDLSSYTGEQALALVHARLADQPAALRRTLVETIARSDGWLATDSALELLRLGTAGGTFSPGEVSTLLAVLESDREKLEDVGPLIRLVGRVDDPAGREALLGTIAMPGFVYAREVATALGELTDSERALLAYNLRANQSQTVRRNVTRLIGALRDANLAGALAETASTDPRPGCRGEALLALGELRGGAALAALQEALLDPERPAFERKVAAVALVAQGRPGIQTLAEVEESEALFAFVSGFRRAPSLTRHDVLRALGAPGGPAMRGDDCRCD